jgi:hypothetical protein
MELIRDILDKQVVDRTQTKIGKIDGLIVELREGKPPRVAYAELGSIVLARRLGVSFEYWARRLATKLGGERHREPHRLAWHLVRDIGVDIEFDIDADETAIVDWQKWLRDHIVAHIPGA